MKKTLLALALVTASTAYGGIKHTYGATFDCRSIAYDSSKKTVFSMTTQPAEITHYDHFGEIMEVSLGTYRLAGMSHRWDWGGENGADYTLVLDPDRDILYYDFSNTEAGEEKGASWSGKCKQKRTRK